MLLYTCFNNYVALSRCKEIIEDDFLRRRHLGQYFKSLNDFICSYSYRNNVQDFLRTDKIIVFEISNDNYVSNLMEINDISQVKIIDIINDFNRLEKYIALL